MSEKPLKFLPFANEADVLEVGNLTIENRVDRLTVSGDVDLTLDQAGLAKARLLHQLLGAAVAKMESLPLPDALPAASVKSVDNPFN
ncbi:MAG: hypothetical protein V4693_18535 [Pseudomonadota bacterium]